MTTLPSRSKPRSVPAAHQPAPALAFLFGAVLKASTATGMRVTPAA